MRTLLPQKGVKTNTCSQDFERAGLIVPKTPLSDAPLDKSSIHPSLKNKVISPSIKGAHSLPVTPFGTSASENEDGRHLVCDSGSSVCFHCSLLSQDQNKLLLRCTYFFTFCK